MPHDTSFQMCIARIFIRVVTAANRQTSSHICVQDVITTCCSTDSKTLHRWRQLPNKVENIEQTLDVPHTLHWIARCSPKLHLPLGDSQAPHHTHGSLVPLESIPQMAPWSVQSFLKGSQLWRTDSRIDHGTLVTPGSYLYIVAIWPNNATQPGSVCIIFHVFQNTQINKESTFRTWLPV